MPKKVSFGADAFTAQIPRYQAEIDEKIRVMDRHEFVYNLNRSGSVLKTKKKREGIQTGLIYTFECFTVVVWTTFIALKGEAKAHGYAWVLIFDERTPKWPVFFSFPIMRTKNFFDTLFCWTRFCVHRVKYWPRWPKENGTFMKMVKLPGVMYAKYFKPLDKHVKNVSLSFYVDMPAEDKVFAEKKFKAYAKWVESQEELGKHPTPRAVLRSTQKKKTEEYRYDDLQYDTSAYNDGPSAE